MRIGWCLIVATVALSGCFGGGSDKLSQAEMQEQAEEAVTAFRSDIGPGGELAAIDVSGTMAVEYELPNGVPATVNLEPTFSVALGPDEDVLVVGELGPLDFTGYCSPHSIIAINQGGEQYDLPDNSVEVRNTYGACTGSDVEPLLLTYFEFELIDPSILTGDLRLQDMSPVGFEDAGDIIATYDVAGPLGSTELVLTIDDGTIHKILAENEHSTLVMELTYGERSALVVPEADERVPVELRGSETKEGGMWSWEGRHVEGGPFGEYTVMVIDDGDVPACGSRPDAVVSFDLGDGADQQKDGWTMVFVDDGDGTLGDDDRIDIQQPGGSIQSFDHDVVIYDEWAGSVTRYDCAIPGAPVGWVGIGIVALAAVVRRRR